MVAPAIAVAKVGWTLLKPLAKKALPVALKGLGYASKAYTGYYYTEVAKEAAKGNWEPAADAAQFALLNKLGRGPTVLKAKDTVSFPKNYGQVTTSKTSLVKVDPNKVKHSRTTSSQGSGVGVLKETNITHKGQPIAQKDFAAIVDKAKKDGTYPKEDFSLPTSVSYTTVKDKITGLDTKIISPHFKKQYNITNENKIVLRQDKYRKEIDAWNKKQGFEIKTTEHQISGRPTDRPAVKPQSSVNITEGSILDAMRGKRSGTKVTLTLKDLGYTDKQIAGMRGADAVKNLKSTGKTVVVDTGSKEAQLKRIHERVTKDRKTVFEMDPRDGKLKPKLRTVYVGHKGESLKYKEGIDVTTGEVIPAGTRSLKFKVHIDEKGNPAQFVNMPNIKLNRKTGSLYIDPKNSTVTKDTFSGMATSGWKVGDNYRPRIAGRAENLGTGADYGKYGRGSDIEQFKAWRSSGVPTHYKKQTAKIVNEQNQSIIRERVSKTPSHAEKISLAEQAKIEDVAKFRIRDANKKGDPIDEIFMSGDSFADDLYAKASVKEAARLKLKIPKITKSTTNVYYGSGQNKELSNLALRPFEYGGKKYKTVEHAYQTLKSGKFDEATYLNKKWGAGVKISGTVKVNKKISNKLMGDLMTESFKQNPKAMEKLKATKGIFTHTQDKGHWGKKFPELLTKIRGGDAIETKAAKNWLLKDKRYTRTVHDYQSPDLPTKELAHDVKALTAAKKWMNQDPRLSGSVAKPGKGVGTEGKAIAFESGLSTKYDVTNKQVSQGVGDNKILLNTTGEQVGRYMKNKYKNVPNVKVSGSGETSTVSGIVGQPDAISKQGDLFLKISQKPQDLSTKPLTLEFKPKVDTKVETAEYLRYLREHQKKLGYKSKKAWKKFLGTHFKPTAPGKG